ncbi:MAG: hypothetical protein COA49_07915 [Bacteroidetes bacterium]|nr:MAG: hypothetical protein COA49_07915 [Bacteroidota bacterium]
MKSVFLIVCLIATSVSWGQYCIPNRFDEPTFSINQIDSIFVQYGQNHSWNSNEMENLYLDVYYPKLNIDPLEKRPLIVMIFPGGFYVGNRQHFKYHCRQLAKRGFVAATIDYRIGWDFGLGDQYESIPNFSVNYTFECLGDANSAISALYRAQQDQKAALRFLVNNADTIRIDTNQIFVGGSSAGGVSALSLQYLSQEFYDTEFPDLDLLGTLGPLESSTNDLSDSFSLAGIFSMWGALPDTSFITVENSIPTLLMHCTGDSLVPCTDSNYYSCSNYPVAQGSCEISKRLENLGECYEFNYYDAPFPDNGCHDVYPYNYHIDRFSKFLKRQFCDDCRQITIENQVEISNNPILSIEEAGLDVSERLLIYPNPTSTVLNIESDIDIEGFELFDILGKTVKKQTTLSRNVIFRVDDIPTGVYLLKVNLISGDVITRQVVIE